MPSSMAVHFIGLMRLGFLLNSKPEELSSQLSHRILWVLSLVRPPWPLSIFMSAGDLNSVLLLLRREIHPLSQAFVSYPQVSCHALLFIASRKATLLAYSSIFLCFGVRISSLMVYAIEVNPCLWSQHLGSWGRRSALSVRWHCLRDTK